MHLAVEKFYPNRKLKFLALGLPRRGRRKNFNFRLALLKEKSKSKNGGFTLMEIILSIALIGILAGGFFFAYRNYQLYSDLDVAAVSVAQSLRRAQLFSQGMNADDDWGVKILTDKIVVFKGDSYSGRNEAYDESVDFPSDVSVSGLSEVVFSKFTGMPQPTGTITISNLSGVIRDIGIESIGQLSY